MKPKSNKYDGIFVCGWCKKETELDDAQVEMMVKEDVIPDYCNCGHSSWGSTIKARFKPNFDGWKQVKVISS